MGHTEGSPNGQVGLGKGDKLGHTGPIQAAVSGLDLFCAPLPHGEFQLPPTLSRMQLRPSGLYAAVQVKVGLPSHLQESNGRRKICFSCLLMGFPEAMGGPLWETGSWAR